VLPGVRTFDDDAFRPAIGARHHDDRGECCWLEDAVPINAATYLDPSAPYTPPVARLDRIDALKSAGQLVHGPLNNHGVVTFVRRNRPCRPSRPSTQDSDRPARSGVTRG